MCLSEIGDVKFYLPFDGFTSVPEFRDVDDYRTYKDGVEAFVRGRNRRIERLGASGELAANDITAS